MDPNSAWAQWTFEYAACYLIGPFIGAFVAGTVFNYFVQTMEDMEVYGEGEDYPADANFSGGLNTSKKVDRDNMA